MLLALYLFVLGGFCPFATFPVLTEHRMKIQHTVVYQNLRQRNVTEGLNLTDSNVTRPLFLYNRTRPC